MHIILEKWEHEGYPFLMRTGCVSRVPVMFVHTCAVESSDLELFNKCQAGPEIIELEVDG